MNGFRIALAVAACSAALLGLADRASAGRPSVPLPFLFEKNLGQSRPDVRFLARGAGYALFLTADGALLRLQPAAGRRDQPPAAIRIGLAGGDPGAEIAGVDPLPGRSHYFIGSDPSRWRTNVPQFARVRYRQLYPGIDLIFYGSDRALEYDFVVSPGGDPGRIRLVYDGLASMETDGEGNLLLHGRDGTVVQRKPVVYQMLGQEVGGGRRMIEGRYRVRSVEPPTTGHSDHARRWEVGVELAAYDTDRTLVIDPVLSYSTYLGGSVDDEGLAIAADNTGQTYVAGTTASVDYPVQGGYQSDPGDAANDGFVTKLSADGSVVVYSTYFGGDGDDRITAIAANNAGFVYITGVTDSSTGFPLLTPQQAVYGGGASDAFLAKLAVAGDALVYSTYLGGSGADEGRGVDADALNNAYVAGVTDTTEGDATPFPLMDHDVNFLAFDKTHNGGIDGFLTKYKSAWDEIDFSTYLGGSGEDQITGLDVTSTGTAVVVGYTDSDETTFPLAQPFQSVKQPGYDAFVTRFTILGDALTFSTFLGGDGDDLAHGVAIDVDGEIVVAGETSSSDFPRKNPVQLHNQGGIDAFVTKYTFSGQQIVYSTYLGGDADDIGYGVDISREGLVYVAGVTAAPVSVAFPVNRPFQGVHGGGQDAFLTELSEEGVLGFSTFLGGTGDDMAAGVTVDGKGDIHLLGRTNSSGFPLLRALQLLPAGGFDLFILFFEGDGPSGCSFHPRARPDIGLTILLAIAVGALALRRKFRRRLSRQQ